MSISVKKREIEKLEFSLLGSTLLAASFFAGLLVMLAGLENLEDAFALDLFLELFQRFFERLIVCNLDF